MTLALFPFTNLTSLKIWANPGLFLFIFGVLKQTIQFLQQISVKISIQYTALGFEPTTS